MVALSVFCLAAAATGCGGPRPPAVLLEPPAEFPAKWEQRALFNTPAAYIYARNEQAAGEADRVVKEVAAYVKRRHQRELGKGLVWIRGPEDAPVARTLEEVDELKNDADLMRTPPAREKPVSEVRREMNEHGIPESATVRGASLPLSGQRLRRLGLTVPGDVPWAVTVPSQALAESCGVEVFAAALRRKQPSLSDAAARDAAARFPGLIAKPFLMTRGQPVFVMWAQQQTDWSDDARRDAIRRYIRDAFRANGLPPPREDDMSW